ncbi:MAG: deoxyribonuclease IV [Bacillota bacterium]|jgi:deoxyribonuclease-4
MFKIGCHISSARGFLSMGKAALQVKANTWQYFSRNPRGGSIKPLDENDLAALRGLMLEQGLSPLVAHAPYTLNACSNRAHLRAFARRVMEEDLERLEYLPGNFYNFHPGSHVGQGLNQGIEYIAELLNAILRPDQSTIVLLETMAGKGSEIGGDFYELAAILEQVELQDKMGVCLDTCHVYDAGYDIVNDLDGVLEQFDSIIGLDKLYLIHLNDSKNAPASRKDRHELIGQGSIGLEAFKRIINHPLLNKLPFVLETPHDLAGYAQEIALLRSLYES